MIAHRASLHAFVSALALAAITLCFAPASNAQRFEGIITFKLSGPAARDPDGARAAGRAGEGRSAEGRAAAGAGRGGAGRAGATTASGAAATSAGSPAAGRGTEARGAPGRAENIRAGRGDVQITPEQAEAMRSAFSTGLQNVEYMTRRGRVRIAVSAGRGGQVAAAMIYAPEDGMMFTLLPALSMYSETAIADLAQMVPDQTTTTVPTAPVPRPPVVTHTKKFELVAGHKCEHVLVEYAKQKTDICMGKGLGVFVMPSVMGRAEGWTKIISDQNGFPLKVTQGNGTVSLEVTKIERKALAESLFNVPETYTRMPDMLRRPPG